MPAGPALSPIRRLVLAATATATATVLLLAACTNAPATPQDGTTAAAGTTTSSAAPLTPPGQLPGRPSTHGSSPAGPNPSQPASSETAPSGPLPVGPELVSGVTVDECILTAADVSALTGRATDAGRNEDTGDAGRRSCDYRTTGSQTPVGRIDVYATTGRAPAAVISTLAGAGSARLITAAPTAAVVIPGIDRGAQFAAATDDRVVVIDLTLDSPPDSAWVAVTTTILTRL